MTAVAEALARGPLKDVDGLVFDLRGRWGGGGSDAAELFVGDTPPFRLIQRNGQDILANVRWHRPVVAIIDEGTRSALEVFAYALKLNGIPLVGTRTAGAVLAGRAFLLPDDSLLELAVSDAVIGDNVRLEGQGVEPDIAGALHPALCGRQGCPARCRDGGNEAHSGAGLISGHSAGTAGTIRAGPESPGARRSVSSASSRRRTTPVDCASPP